MVALTERQTQRLMNRFRESGAAGQANRRRGQPGNRQLMPGLAERALRIIRERYADFGPTLACEKLAEVHGLYLVKETVRKLMTLAGLWIPRKLRPSRVHQPRPRRACTGELIQIDGCEHRWFEERGRRGNLIKVLWADSDGLSLFTKRPERGRFVWPVTRDGKVHLTPAQLSMLLEGINWKHPKRTERAGIRI
ncbi:IS66 family insertion sequence element accessory protein TnpB [Escherichia coli]|nr:IS66 family insertion sequence element accessory protein TnpB [Escherichia coli]